MKVAGGIEAGTGVFESLVKECVEEASISPNLVSSARATGTIRSSLTRFVTVLVCFYAVAIHVFSFSYFHEAPDGLEPETEFIYELELPLSFVPIPQDGEVSEFYLWDVEKVGCSLDIFFLLATFLPVCVFLGTACSMNVVLNNV